MSLRRILTSSNTRITNSSIIIINSSNAFLKQLPSAKFQSQTTTCTHASLFASSVRFQSSSASAPKPEQFQHAGYVMSIINNQWILDTLYAVVKLHVFDHLPLHPATTTAEKIATTLSLHPQNLRRALRFLVNTKLVIEHPDGSFSATESGTLFQRTHPLSMYPVIMFNKSKWHMDAWYNLSEVIKEGNGNGTGGTGYKRAHGIDWIELLQSNNEYRTTFENAMRGYSALEIPFIVNTYNWKGVKTICDVGGNSGHVVCSIAKAHSHITGSCLDLEPIIKNATTAKDLGVADKIKYIPGNFFTGDGFDKVKGTDVYLMKYILHDWNDTECIKILSTIHKTSKPDAKIVDVDFCMPPTGAPDNGARGMDCNMLAAITGKERTEEEFKELFGNAGWKLVKNTPSGFGMSIFEVVKV
ncbi:hypothetical protein HDU76_003951 [Blyttiomyces sp. JEL0837]|nr:hypothetical protein HDU76_003951 [Blyttiomyces sp. JEL0837]